MAIRTHQTSDDPHGERGKDMKEKITIEISPKAFRELLLLKRTDLPPKISIEVASQLHPFLKEILDALYSAAHKIHKKRETKMMTQAILTIEKSENI